ncbi:MAG: DUF501 domain-containing protein [Dermabacter sp.]|nr:DUF501 domain-containing protein [Dermabacter sp.]
MNDSLPPLPFESPATAEDLAIMARQVGRTMRGVHSVARRCACGAPAVVRTEPRLPDGTPFPTSLYLTLPSLVEASSRLEARGVLAAWTEELATDAELRQRYAAAHERYLARRAELGSADEVEGVSAGGMPTRVKCIHAVVGQSLAEGPGINPMGDRALEEFAAEASIDVCRCQVRPEPARRVAAIDCGTNSIRLLIADVQADGSLVDVERRMEFVRLGEGVDRTGALAPEAIARTLEATREYAALIEKAGASAVRFAATSATRDASNRAEFIDGVQRILGVSPEVITGDEEALLSYRGAVQSLPEPGRAPRLVVDIGGGSTELVFGLEEPASQISLDMGSVRLTERFLLADPPTEQQIQDATKEIDALLDAAAPVIDFARVRTVVGVAGTVTTLTAALLGLEEYTPERTHGAILPLGEIEELCQRVLHESREERSARAAIHPGRIDVIGAGALIWSRILERVRAGGALESVITSEHDILDGLAMSVADRL